MQKRKMKYLWLIIFPVFGIIIAAFLTSDENTPRSDQLDLTREIDSAAIQMGKAESYALELERKKNEAYLDERYSSSTAFLNSFTDDIEDAFESDEDSQLVASEVDVVSSGDVVIDVKPKPVKVRYVIKEVEKSDSVKIEKPPVRNSFNSYASRRKQQPQKAVELTETSTNKVVVFGNQMVRPGGLVEMKLMEAINTKSTSVPAGTIINGIVSFSGDRVIIRVESINTSARQIPVNTLILDDNGVEGIYAPELIETDNEQRLINSAIDEASRPLNIPLIGTAKAGKKNNVNDRRVQLYNGHTLTAQFEIL